MVGEWLVGRAVLIEGEQNIFKKDISNFERFKLFLQELFFRNYFPWVRTDVKRTNSYWAKFTSN